MMSSYIALGVGVAFFVMLILVVFWLPNSSKRKKRRGRPPEQQPKQKDWKAATLKMEKHVYALRREIVDLQRSEKNLDSKLINEQRKSARLKDKLSQEKGWHEKEQKVLEKRGEELVQLKKDLCKAEQNSGEEHARRLRIERELKELKESWDDLNEQRRKLEGENLKLKVAVDNDKKELNELRREKRELQKKKEDTSWIAKSEFVRLEKMLKEKEKEIERLTREL